MGTSSSSTADPVIAVAQAVARTPSLDEIANVNTANVQPEVPVKPAANNENLTKENTQGKETFSIQQNIVQQQPKTTQGDITTITNYLEALSVSRDPIPVKATKPIPEACVTNLNALLSDIYVRYIKLDEEAFERYYKVFDAIFLPLNKKMKEVDPYYNKYQSMVKFAGSHYDNLLLQKPNDFDVDIVIGLPLNMKIDPTNPELSDVVIQAINPGFVQLKMGPQFQNLPMRDGTEWLINKTAYKWKDDSHYLLQSKFLDWFKSVVNKALNTFENKNCLSVYTVEGVEYVIKRSQAGPAMTLIIENSETGFKLSADLVPTIKFPEDRWPISKAYQRIPENCKKDIWMVVGKPNKAAANKQDEQRSWRIALHYQERDLMHDTSNLRQVIRLVKKMRDALGMKKIASYYIKTIFFWEIIKRNDKKFWKMDPASLFKLMVRQVHCAIVARNIPYFWNKSNNLIGHVEDNILKNYEIKLSQLLEILEQPTSFRLVAKYLLSPQEYKEYSERHPVPAKAVQLTPEVKLMSDACNFTNLNSLLSDIYVKYIKLDEEAFTRYYKVFDAIFLPLNKKMKEVDPYYNKYQSMVKFAGSHYDNLLLQKPNDFDVDIVIGLPLNMKIDPTNPELSDVGIQAINPGFVQLKMGPQFQNLPMRDGTEWLINKTAYKWKDDSHYLLQSKFLDWFKSVVNKALNTFENKNCLSVYTVEGVEYVIKRSQAGPAMTLIIENSETGFKLSADLVPTIKFPEDRWPISKAYQRIPENCKKDIWMVVGKPNKAAANKQDEQRSWRIALHYQERDLMHDTSNLRQVIRLIKKMRDALGMTKIASYYIKTIFYWEIVKRNDKKFWATDPATLFKLMVRQVHRAIVDKNIPYFWNKSNNLIGHVDDNVLKNYESKLAPLLEILEQPTNFRLVAKFLLSPQEFKEYNKRYLHL